MKATLQSSDLQSIMNAAAAISKSPHPIQIILEKIGEDATDPDFEPVEHPPEAGQIRIIAFNDTIVSEWRRPAEIRMGGHISVLPAGLKQLVTVSKGADSTMTLETTETSNEKALRVSTARSAHEFGSVSGEIFHAIAPGHSSGPLLDLSALSVAINTAKIGSAGSADATGARLVLTGVHIRERNGYLDVVGTDGKRLALSTLQKTDLGAISLGPLSEQGITLPAEAASLVAQMLGAGQARLEVIDNNVVIENSEGSLSVRLIDLNFPDYPSLLGRPCTNTISLPKSALEIALQRSSVALARDPRSVAVKLSRDIDGIHLTATAAGQSSAETVSEKGGDDAAIGFDGRYMSAAIAVFGKSNVDIMFGDERTPIQIASPSRPEVTMLIMPCRVAHS
jgi:DNA polymerase III subunit beta